MDRFRQRYGSGALITGASSGIGEALARALAARQMDLVLVARRGDRLRQLGQALEAAHGVRVVAVTQDITAEEAPGAIRAAVARAGIDVGLLINNAGFTTYGEFHATNDGSQSRMVDLHCRAPVALTEAFLPEMIARGRGGLIFVASMAGYQPTPYMATYGATKAFKLSFAHALGAELRPYGIDVLGLCPGYVPTEFQELSGTHDLPAPGVLSAEAVAEEALRVLGRRPAVVPGLRNQLSLGIARILPRSWVTALTARALKPKRALPGLEEAQNG